MSASFAEGLRRNKIASILALIAFIAFVSLALGSRYDERPRYRQVILPGIERSELLYHAALERMVAEPKASRRVYHLINAHERAVDVLKFIRSRRPMTAVGTMAHMELIRYYRRVDEAFAILRSEMSIDEEIDFLDRWEEIRLKIRPIYERWSTWIEQ